MKRHDALGQQLRDHPSTRGAHGQSYADFTAACRASRQHHAGHVDRGDRQQHAGNHEERGQEGDNRRAQRLKQRRVGIDVDTVPFLLAILEKREGHRIERGARLLDTGPGRQTPDGLDRRARRLIRQIRAREHNALRRDRHPQVHEEDHHVTLEAGLGDPDHREPGAIELNLAPDDVRLAAEALLPEPVRDDDDQVAPRDGVLLGMEEAPERRADAHHLQVVGRHQRSLEAERRIVDHQPADEGVEGSELYRVVAAGGHGPVQRDAERVEARAILGEAVHRHQALLVAHPRGHPQEQPVGDAEDGRSGADTDRHCQDGHHGEHGLASQTFAGETNVPQSGFHRCPASGGELPSLVESLARYNDEQIRQSPRPSAHQWKGLPGRTMLRDHGIEGRGHVIAVFLAQTPGANAHQGTIETTGTAHRSPLEYPTVDITISGYILSSPTMEGVLDSRRG